MKYNEAKLKYLQAWGTLGTSWGINRTMAQIHALLMVSDKILSVEEIMSELKISGGNANQNIRSLLEWGLIKKELVPGERKEYFVAEKDVSKIFKQVIKERRKRELQPLLDVLEELNAEAYNILDAKERVFSRQIGDLQDFAKKADKSLAVLESAEHQFLMQLISKFVNI